MSVQNQSKLTIVIGLLILFLLTLVPSAYALEIFSEEEVIIGAGEVIEDDLFVMANHVVVDGTIKGDLLAIANQIEINGLIEGDLMAGAQEITINGRVTDDVRLGATVITIGEAAQITDDLMAGAYSLETLAGSLVDGEMYYAGGQSRLAGDVGENLWVSAGGLELLGQVAGDVQAEVGAASDQLAFSPLGFVPDAPQVETFAWGLTVADEAVVGGDLIYTTPDLVIVPPNVVDGTVEFEQILPAIDEAAPVPVSTTDKVITWTLDQARRYVTLLLVGLVMMWILRRWTTNLVKMVTDKPLPSLGWGLVTVIAVIGLIVVLFIGMILLALFFDFLTLGDLSGSVIAVSLLALFALVVAFSLAITYVANVVVSLAIGEWFMRRFNVSSNLTWLWALLFGLLLVVVLTALPIIGGLINLFLVLIGLGAIWQDGRQAWERRSAAPKKMIPPEPRVKPA